jgi:hypothetical protein
MGPFRRDDLRDSANTIKKDYPTAQGESVPQHVQPRNFYPMPARGFQFVR